MTILRTLGLRSSVFGHWSSRHLAVLCVVAAGLACSDRPDAAPTGPSAAPLFSVQGPRPDLRPAIAAQGRHTDALLRIAGVVGTAVGLMSDGRPGVQILLERQGVSGLPASIEGIPVDARVIGAVRAFSDPTARRRPAPLGYSVGHPLITIAGTIGARVKDAVGNVYILSSNHVLANLNVASIGDAVYQPGPFDRGNAADQIATLSDFQVIGFHSFYNYVDAAIARTIPAQTSNATPTDDGYGLPNARIYGDVDNNGVFDDRNALLGLNVQKYGRTTKLTHGQITGVNARVTVCYTSSVPCLKSATFADQLIITPGTFSGWGDSGSLLVTDDANRNPVGLLFAGTAALTVANRIDYVLGRFNVSIDGAVTPPPPPPVTDLAVSVSAPVSAVVGDVVNVVVTVSNIGNQNIAGSIPVALLELKNDGAKQKVGFQNITGGLAVGASAPVTFSLPSAGAPIGPHLLVAIQGVSDANAANNWASVTVTLNP